MALRISLRFSGDPRWYDRLPREDQIAVLAMLQIDAEDTDRAARGRR